MAQMGAVSTAAALPPSLGACGGAAPARAACRRRAPLPCIARQQCRAATCQPNTAPLPPHVPLLQPAGAPGPAAVAAAPAPGPAAAAGAAADCPFTLRVGGVLIPVAEAPDKERYIVSCRSEEHRRQLAQALPQLVYLTEGTPLLVGTLSREELLWMCQDPAAAAAVDYIERDEIVTIAAAGELRR